MAIVDIIYFAAVDPLDVFDELIHSVEDEEVFFLKIDHSEGEFATLEVEIKNPSEGLLSSSRKERVFISIENGGTPILIFSGRIIGSPTELTNETVRILYIAQPEDWDTVQDTFLDTLKVAPFFNQLYIPADRRNLAEEILAGRPELLHWNRSTNALSISNIIEGNSFIDLAGDIIQDTVRVDIGDPPLKSVDINIEAQWEQVGLGTVDVGKQIRLEFTNTAIGTPQINTLTPLAFEDGWRGARIPTGYTIEESTLIPVADQFGLAQGDLRSGAATVDGVDFPTKAGATPPSRSVTVPRVWYEGRLVLQAVYQQKRREAFTATLEATTQDFSLKGNKTEDLSIRLQNPSADAQGSIFDAREASFFFDIAGAALTTDGRAVIEHGLMRARARLMKSSRIIEVRFQTNLENVIEAISCDHNIRIEDDRIPGGSIRWKVLGYTLSVDGPSGQTVANIVIGAVIGTGSDSVGTGAPSEVKIADTSFANEFGASPMSSAVFYDLPVDPTISVPIDVAQMESDDTFLIDGVTVDNDGETQNDAFVLETRPDTFLAANGTGVTVDLKSMNPDAELFATVTITTTPMTLPIQTDLEAT